MRTTILAGLLAASTAVTTMLPAVAVAQDYGDRGGYRDGQNDRGDPNRQGGSGNRDGRHADYRWNGDRNGGWDPSSTTSRAAGAIASASLVATTASIVAVMVGIIVGGTTERPVW